MSDETWEEEEKRREDERAVEWTRKNLERIPERYRDVAPITRDIGSGLYLNGPVGTGKTWAAAGIMRCHIDQGKRTRWLTVPTWLQRQRESFSDDASVESIESLSIGDLLVLDDIGVERATDWALEMLYVLINEAYNHETPMVVTGNLTYPQLADKVGARIVSRLAAVCRPVEIKGSDRRLSA